jgi:diacylglycerol kinase family enzyme
MKRAVLIVNPYASAVTDARTAAVERALTRVADVRTVRTEGPRHATELARTAGDADALVVFSGDGGFNEVLNGVERGDLPLGFVPGGGTSVLPRALGLPRDPVKAAQRVAQGRTRRIGLGRVNGRRFAFSAGLGFDAELVRRVDELGRRPDGRRPGDLAFLRVAAGAIRDRRGRFDEQLEIEGHGRAAFVLVANGSPYTYAGAFALDLVPGADFDAGLAFFAPVNVRARDLPRILVRGARGSALKEDRALAGRDLDRIVVRCDRPLPLQVDGDDAGDAGEVVYESERDAVSVLV